MIIVEIIVKDDKNGEEISLSEELDPLDEKVDAAYYVKRTSRRLSNSIGAAWKNRKRS